MTTQESRNVKPRNQRLIWIGIASLLLLGGCNKQPATNTAAAPAEQAPAAAQPSAPETQTPQTPAAASASAPAAAPAAAAAPAQSAMAAAPPPPPPPVYTVPSGSHLAVRISGTISSKTNSVGDSFRGTLAQSVRVGGVTVLRAGTPVSGTVVASKGQGRFKGAGDLGIALNTVGSQSVTTTAYEKSVQGKGKRSAGFIGGGGGGGALIGGLAGGGKGALIGGLLGAGAGTAGAGLTGNTVVAIPAESVVSFTLTSPIRIVGKPPAAESAPQQ